MDMKEMEEKHNKLNEKISLMLKDISESIDSDYKRHKEELKILEKLINKD